MRWKSVPAADKSKWKTQMSTRLSYLSLPEGKEGLNFIPGKGIFHFQRLGGTNLSCFIGRLSLLGKAIHSMCIHHHQRLGV
jgi:hypothetical protein